MKSLVGASKLSSGFISWGKLLRLSCSDNLLGVLMAPSLALMKQMVPSSCLRLMYSCNTAVLPALRGPRMREMPPGEPLQRAAKHSISYSRL